jgi:hypothetical protein
MGDDERQGAREVRRRLEVMPAIGARDSLAMFAPGAAEVVEHVLRGQDASKLAPAFALARRPLL